MQPESTVVVRPHDTDETGTDQSVILGLLEQQIGSRNLQHWFAGKTIFTFDGEELVVGVANPFLLDWMQKRFRDAVAEIARSQRGPSARVRFEIDSRIATLTDDQVSATSKATVETEESTVQTPPTQTPPTQSSPTRPSQATRDSQATQPREAVVATRMGRRFSDLADFVCGTSNELALTAAKQVCAAPGTRFNPLFVHGGVGLGKTHLLEGIYRTIRRQHPALNVTYLTSVAFTNYFTEALRERTLPSFRQRFRTVDVLLVDDIDFLDSKRVVQEEFLHTFKQLESHGRQIVLTSDRHPRLLTKISDELSTRFLSGLVCRIETPQIETRREIVERKAAVLKTDISPEALDFVAGRFRNNVRELEGALNCLATYREMTGRRVRAATARRVLAELERDCIRVVRMGDVEQSICSFFGLDPEELKSKQRRRTVSRPRMLAMFLSRKHTQAAYSEIGRYFGGRNHSTVMSAERQVQSWVSEGATVEVASQTWSMREVLEALEQQLQAC
jgi:chromosomal replication initiator protein